jgi:hypothetical protein
MRHGDVVFKISRNCSSTVCSSHIRGLGVGIFVLAPRLPVGLEQCAATCSQRLFLSYKADGPLFGRHHRSTACGHLRGCAYPGTVRARGGRVRIGGSRSSPDLRVSDGENRGDLRIFFLPRMQPHFDAQRAVIRSSRVAARILWRCTVGSP